jgi:hypothetical protein
MSCGHAVVAPSLLDLTPLLMAVEHELRSAEVAARPYRKKEKRPLHWQATGLGMLHRLWRAGDDTRPIDTRPAQWIGWVILALALLWLFGR